GVQTCALPISEVAVFGLWDGPARGGAQVGLGLAAADDAWYVPAPLTGPIIQALDGKPLAGHDVKEMQLALQSYRRDSPSPHNLQQWKFSTSLAAYLLGAGSRDPRLEDLARDFLGMNLMHTDQLLEAGRNI